MLNKQDIDFMLQVLDNMSYKGVQAAAQVVSVHMKLTAMKQNLEDSLKQNMEKGNESVQLN